MCSHWWCTNHKISTTRPLWKNCQTFVLNSQLITKSNHTAHYHSHKKATENTQGHMAQEALLNEANSDLLLTWNVPGFFFFFLATVDWALPHIGHTCYCRATSFISSSSILLLKADTFVIYLVKQPNCRHCGYALKNPTRWRPKLFDVWLHPQTDLLSNTP